MSVGTNADSVAREEPPRSTRCSAETRRRPSRRRWSGPRADAAKYGVDIDLDDFDDDDSETAAAARRPRARRATQRRRRRRQVRGRVRLGRRGPAARAAAHARERSAARRRGVKAGQVKKLGMLLEPLEPLPRPRPGQAARRDGGRQARARDRPRREGERARVRRRRRLARAPPRPVAGLSSCPSISHASRVARASSCFPVAPTPSARAQIVHLAKSRGHRGRARLGEGRRAAS